MDIAPTGTVQRDDAADGPANAVTKSGNRADHEIELKDGGIAEEVQAGVRDMEAVTAIWTRTHLVTAYVLIWLIYVVDSMQTVMIRALDPYVTSAFRLHSMTATTQILASVISGVSKLPLAKVMDKWGRPQGLTLMLVFTIVGFSMMAACQNVETYAAAQVFMNVGIQGITYCTTVFIADTSSLKNRGLVLAYALSPYIVITWIGGPLSEAVLRDLGFRWGFGLFAIFSPTVVLPLVCLFAWNQHKARRNDIIPPRARLRDNLSWVSLKKVARDIDLLGIIILCAGLALFLLPFSLYSYQPQQWRSPLIITLIIFGGLLIIAFVLYERFLAPSTFIPYALLTNRTVLFGGLMHVFVFFSLSIWFPFFTSTAQVVYGLNVTKAAYVTAIQRVGSCFWALVVGVLIRWSGRFKWLGLYIGVPLLMLGTGLMIPFVQPGFNVGLLALTQILISFAHGTVTITGEIAMMAPSNHENIAAIIAILNVFMSIGNALGRTVSSAMWTGTFYRNLRKFLPSNVDARRVYADIKVQLSFPVGSLARDAIDRAYGETLKYMLTASVAISMGAIICVALWRDINLKNVQQTRGLVV